MKEDIKKLILIYEISFDELLYFNVSNNKFYIYSFNIPERKKKGHLYTLTVGMFVIFLRMISKYSGWEYVWLRTLFLCGITLIAGIVVWLFLMNSNDMEEVRDESNWSERKLSGDELEYYAEKFLKSKQKLFVTIPITFLTAVMFAVLYVLWGSIIVLAIYLFPLLMIIIVLNMYSYKNYQVATQNIIQLIEGEKI